MGKGPAERRDERLHRAFDQMVLLCFPHWATAETWKARAAFRTSETNEDGYCDPDRRTIFVAPHIVEEGGVDLHRIVAHECCHAVAGLGHGAVFLRRLRAATTSAHAGGRHELAEALFKEADAYEKTPVTRAAHIYGWIEDAAEQGATFEAAVAHASRSCGMTRAEITMRYRRAKRVYENHRERQRSILAASPPGLRQN